MRIGVISDTHGLLRPEALEALEGSGHILHAGDIGDPAILGALGRIAPVDAIRGNNDAAAWAKHLRDSLMVEIAGVRIHIVHDAKALGGRVPHGTRVVVSGHSHVPRIVEGDGVLHVNPGSAGPRRFRLPLSVARLTIRDENVEAELVALG